jgi:DNA repair protein RadD
MIQERPYQTNVIAEFMRTTATFNRIILVAPTGSGKTVIGGSIIKEYVARHRLVLVLCHRAEIINQTVAKLRELGLWVGIIWAEAGRLDVQPLAPVQVASIPTLHARAIRTERMQLPDANLIVVDEAHHVRARTWREILDATILGLTATPCRGDGRGLGGIFETMIECPQVAELIELKYLVKSRDNRRLERECRLSQELTARRMSRRVTTPGSPIIYAAVLWLAIKLSVSATGNSRYISCVFL